MIQLRPKQQVFTDNLRAAFASHRRVLGVGPTGFGKTVVFSHITHGAAAKGNRVAIIAHRIELCDQISGALKAEDVPHGFVAKDYPVSNAQTLVCSLQTLVRRLDKVEPPQLLIIDEAHHAVADTYRRIVNHWPNAKILGVTATPVRTSGEGLGDIFQAMVLGPTVAELIADHHLAPFRVFAPPTMDTSQLHLKYGDFIPAELTEVADKPSVTGSAVAEYRKMADGKRALAFCVSVEHAHHVANEFRQAGYSALALDGKTDPDLRRRAVADYRRGAIQIMASCDLFSEGFDVPGVECGIFLRPTASLGLFMQQVGRCLRTSEGKGHAILLDHASNVRRFGLPDEPRAWSLDGEEKKKKGEQAESCRVCPACFAANSMRIRECAECGFVFPIKSRQVEEREGELEEITAETLARRAERREQGRAQSLEQLREFAKRKGYKPGWAERVWAARNAKKGKAA